MGKHKSGHIPRRNIKISPHFSEFTVSSEFADLQTLVKHHGTSLCKSGILGTFLSFSQKIACSCSGTVQKLSTFKSEPMFKCFRALLRRTRCLTSPRVGHIAGCVKLTPDLLWKHAVTLQRFCWKRCLYAVDLAQHKRSSSAPVCRAWSYQERLNATRLRLTMQRKCYTARATGINCAPWTSPTATKTTLHMCSRL